MNRRVGSTSLIRLAAVPLALAAATPAATAGQSVRITGTTTARYVDLRPFVEDSVAFAGTTDIGNPMFRQMDGSVLVRCVEGDAQCRYLRSGEVESAIPILQDLQVTGWGFAEGLSAHAHLRARASAGTADRLWPRADDRFDAIDAYVELDRSSYVVRAGRQWMTSGLGVRNFDGAQLVYHPTRALTLEGFGGWGLAVGANEPKSSAEYGAIEDLPPAARTNVFGGAVRWRGPYRSAANVFYQREIRTDRAAMHSERIAADGRVGVGPTVAEGWLAYDFATAYLNEARVRLRLPQAWGVTSHVEARRYRPFFELWTIWGAFAPIGFDEARASAFSTLLDERLSLDVSGAYRRYDETDAGFQTFMPLRNDGWRLGGSASFRMTPAATLSGGYNMDVGFGAARSDAYGAVRWEPGERYFVGAMVTGFQNIFEFRVGRGRVIGFGGDAGLRINDQMRAVGDLMVYNHTATGGLPTTDWSQKRASLRLEWMLGSDPGMRAQEARR
jgi:hypothetical protein